MGSYDGSDDEKPVHTVYLDAFYIDIYEVTNAQYEKFMDATGHNAPIHWDDPDFNVYNLPVVGVSWYDAMAYAEWAGKRLPTEAEWEKAARGGLVGKKFPWGNSFSYNHANGGGSSWNGPAPVGRLLANGYGLYDMAGNVKEWCFDWYTQNYAISPTRNPRGPSSGAKRVIRGGSFRNNIGQLSNYCRLARGNPSHSGFDIGFRCVQDMIPAADKAENTDPEYENLKMKPIDEMSDREYEYFMIKQRQELEMKTLERTQSTMNLTIAIVITATIAVVLSAMFLLH